MSPTTGKIGIVGCGYAFDIYMATLAYHPQLTIGCLWDTDGQRLEQVAKFYNLPAASCLADVLSDSEIILVLNLTSIDAHEEVTRAALIAGKHVYCEKPLVTDIEVARSLFSLAAQQGLMLMAAPSNLFSDSVQTMWRAVSDGAIGLPLLAYAEFDDNPIYLMNPEGWRSRTGAPWPWKDEYEAGCTWEHIGYHLTWLCAIFGPVRRFTAFSKVCVPHKSSITLDPPDTPDFSVAILDFQSGPTARITCSIAAPLDHRMRVIGDEGEISTDTYRHYRSPVRLERFTTLSLNARKAVAVRRHAMLGSLLGVGGKKLRLLEFTWSRKNMKAFPRNWWALHKAIFAATKHHQVGAQDKMLGVALTISAIVNGKSQPLPSDFILHVTELTLAIQLAGSNGSALTPSNSFKPLAPLEDPIRPLEDWRKSHSPSFLHSVFKKIISRLHRH
jgi:predicted dehydrogenase